MTPVASRLRIRPQNIFCPDTEAAVFQGYDQSSINCLCVLEISYVSATEGIQTRVQAQSCLMAIVSHGRGVEVALHMEHDFTFWNFELFPTTKTSVDQAIEHSIKFRFIAPVDSTPSADSQDNEHSFDSHALANPRNQLKWLTTAALRHRPLYAMANYPLARVQGWILDLEDNLYSIPIVTEENQAFESISELLIIRAGWEISQKQECRKALRLVIPH